MRAQSRIHQRRKILRNILVSVVGVGVLTLFGFLTRGEQFQIKQITVLGDTRVSEAEIEEFVRAQLAGSYMWLLPRGSIALYPKAKIKEQLISSYPRLAEVNVDANLNGTLTVIATDHNEKYIYNGKFVDEEGRPFAVAPAVTPSGSIEFVSSSTPSRELISSTEALSSSIIEIKSVISERDTVRFVTKEGWYIKANATDESNGLIIRLIATLSASPLSATTSRQNLEYLDVRLQSKIFYKFK